MRMTTLGLNQRPKVQNSYSTRTYAGRSTELSTLLLTDQFRLRLYIVSNTFRSSTKVWQGYSNILSKLATKLLQLYYSLRKWRRRGHGIMIAFNKHVFSKIGTQTYKSMGVGEYGQRIICELAYKLLLSIYSLASGQKIAWPSTRRSIEANRSAL